MLVSVIIPAYNAGNTISRCVESILIQTHKNIEIIIINDGSTDNTEDIIFHLQENDCRIKYVTVKNGGVSRARNKGIELSSGDFVMFVDADDYIESNMIEELLSAYQGTPICVVAGHYRESVSGCDVERRVDDYYLGYVWGKLFSKCIIDCNKIYFNTEISLQEDMIFVLEYIAKCKNCKLVNKPLYHYIDNPRSLSSKYSPGLELSEQLATKAYLELKEVYPEFCSKAIIEDKNRRVITALKIEYNDCAIDSPVKRYERLNKLKTLLNNPEFIKELKLSPNSGLAKIFIYGMRLRLVSLVDFSFYIIKRIRSK